MNPKAVADAILTLWNRQTVTRYSEQKSHWVTIGAERGADGKNHGGNTVKIKPDGTIEAGLGGKFNGQKIDQAFKHRPSAIERDNEFEADLLKWRGMVSQVGKSRGFYGYDLDDFISETMMTAWKYRGRYDASKGAISTWLHSVAENVAHNLRRRNRAKKRGSGRITQSIDAFNDGSMPLKAKDQAENLSEQLELLKPMIAKLPDSQRRAVRGLMDGKTVAEMADYLKMSRQAVSQSLNRGIEALKKMTVGDDRFSVACEVERYAETVIREVPELEDFEWRSIGRQYH